jgi:TPR repeat protein
MKRLRHFALIAALVAAQTAGAQDLTDVPLDLVRQGADNGAPVAQVELATRYLDGKEVLQNFAIAAQWLQKAADQGDAAAQNGLGKLYHAGFGVERDVPRALDLLLQATKSGNPQYLFDYASALETAETGADVAQAAEYYERAAQAGHLEASVSLGVLYQEGRGVTQDLDRARTLYETAAEKNHPRALNNLGLLFVRGDGVAQDYDRAARLFERAVDLGLSTAMTNLGVMYENGFGVPLDEAKAAALYRLASTANDTGKTTGFYNDPRLMPLGAGAEAIKQAQSAAVAGDPVAQFQLALALATQPDAPFQNIRTAAQLFETAARAGHGPSMANLSLMYFKGQGLPQDYMLGQMWSLLANRAGVDTFRINAAFGAKVTANQMNTAQQHALALLNSIKG